MAVTASYPAIKRIFTTKVDLEDTSYADHINLLQAEVTAIEGTVGVSPEFPNWAATYRTTASAFTNVSDRIANTEAGLLSLAASKAEASTAATLEGSQTLKNKTMSGTDNTFSAIPVGAITGLSTALAAYAPLASPTFTGVPAAPTAVAGTNTTQVATTAFVKAAVDAASPGTGSITTAMIANGAVYDAQVNAAAGIAQSKISGLTSDLALKAPLAGPTFTGVPAAPTAAADTNTTQIATTAYVIAQGYLKSATAASTYATIANLALKAPIAGPTFTGLVTVVSPTGGSGTVGVRQTYISTGAPSGGADGDIWIQYTP